MEAALSETQQFSAITGDSFFFFFLNFLIIFMKGELLGL